MTAASNPLVSSWLAGPALFFEGGSCTRKSGSATPAPPLVPPPGANPVRIGIDVRANGRLQITLWRGSDCNATYAVVDKAEALARCLPEAIEEAIEFAQEAARHVA